MYIGQFPPENNKKKTFFKNLTIFEFSIIHSVDPPSPHPCLRRKKSMRNLMLSNALGNMQSYQEHLKTTVYIKIGGQTERIIEDSKIENAS